MMKVISFTGGEAETNAYLVFDPSTKEAMIVDAPHGLADDIVAKANELGGKVVYLVNTHGHWDHIADNAAILKATGAKLLIHPDDEKLVTNPELMTRYGLFFEIEPTKPSGYLNEGDNLKLGNWTFGILHCPGHCPGSIVLYERSAKLAIVGDVIFAGSVGRTDLPGCSWEQLRESIEKNILTLPDDVKLLPGHGPATTVGQERKTNPFLRE
ncbi:MAG: MBL fold metallo-hydrolase [Verrucomicrobiae bacterium]|nr:MBL fold metallo-hydrolase [Verrucomicrobiae bacterium]